MIVFKTFLKILNKNKIIILIYTMMLIIFSASNMQTQDNGTNFEASKPNVVIINNDDNSKITKNLIAYIESNCNIKNIAQTEDSLNDALFYREVNYIIYIPKNYSQEFLKGNNPEIEIKSTGDYQSSLAEMMLTRYLNVANIYVKNLDNEEDIIEKINQTLEKNTKIEMTTKLDTDNLAKATFYYNFLNYSIIAGLVYVICLILLSFRKEDIRKRTIISSMKYSKVNIYLLLSNGILAGVLWLIYVILSFILVGNIMFTIHGLILIINSFVFSICALCIAFLIANLINNKNAVSGIINVVGLGSSFLCGSFIPVEWLPTNILKIARILPSYWYIQNNEIVESLEIVNIENLKPVIENMLIVILFSIAFVILTNIISKRKRKIG